MKSWIGKSKNLVFAAGFLVQLLALSSTSTVFAATTNITQLKFTSSAQSITTGATSAALTVQTQNASGTLEALSTSGTKLVLATSSPTGEFSSNGTSGWAHSLTLTMSSGTANKNFYYHDSTAGTPTLTASATDANGVAYSWTPATQSITVTAPILVDTTAPTVPVASVPAGTYDVPQTLTLSSSDNESGLEGIYYTTDGSLPTTASIKYIGPITVATSQTITAMARDIAGNQSAAVSFAYAISPPLLPADTTKPTVTITSPTVDTINPANYQVVAHDDHLLSTVMADLYKDTQLIKACAAQNVNAADYTLNCLVPSGLADGTYTIRSSAVDEAGNISDVVNQQFTIRTTTQGGGTGAVTGDTTSTDTTSSNTSTTSSTNSGQISSSSVVAVNPPTLAATVVSAGFGTATATTPIVSSSPLAATTTTNSAEQPATESIPVSTSQRDSGKKSDQTADTTGKILWFAWYWWLVVGVIVILLGQLVVWWRRRNTTKT